MVQFAEGHRVLSTRQVVDRTTLSRATLWRLQKKGLFPRSFQISPGRVGWLEGDVLAWLSAKAGQSHD